MNKAALFHVSDFLHTILILELLPRVNQALLFRVDALLLLDLCFDMCNGGRLVKFKLKRTSRQSTHFDGNSSAQTQHEVKRRLLLDVVVRQRAPVFELLSGKNQALRDVSAWVRWSGGGRGAGVSEKGSDRVKSGWWKKRIAETSLSPLSRYKRVRVSVGRRSPVDREGCPPYPGSWP